jgi:hypothetical protein
MANQIGGILNGNPGPYAIPQRSLRRPIDRCVMRSTAAFHEEQKPSREKNLRERSRDLLDI